MRYLNTATLVGLILCGAVLVAGQLLGNGNLLWLGAYTGWFLAAYSIMAYVVASLFYAMRGTASFWRDLYAANFALSLLGFAAFGISSTKEVMGPVVAALVAGIVGLVLARRYDAKLRLVPIATTLVVAGPLLESIATMWVYVFVGTAGALIGLTLVLSRGSKPTPALP